MDKLVKCVFADYIGGKYFHEKSFQQIILKFIPLIYFFACRMRMNFPEEHSESDGEDKGRA